MPLKFCLGAPNISAGYAVANVHLMISLFMIIILAGVVDALGTIRILRSKHFLGEKMPIFAHFQY